MPLLVGTISMVIGGVLLFRTEWITRFVIEDRYSAVKTISRKHLSTSELVLRVIGLVAIVLGIAMTLVYVMN